MYGDRGAHSEPSPFRVFASVPWLVVLSGVVVMVFLLVAAVSWLPADSRSAGAPPAFVPNWPFAPGSPSSGAGGASATAPGPGSPGFPSTPSGHPSANPSGEPPGVGSGAPMTNLPATAPAPKPTRTRPAPAPPPPPPPPPAPPPQAPPALTGHYQLMASYQDGFIGEVVVRNGSGSDRQWTVELRFPSGVGELRTFWVESAPQATLRRSGGLFTFTSTVALPARSSVPLRFHFERTSGGNFPVECRVSGTSCTGL